MKIRMLLRTVSVIQIVLGLMYLLMPLQFLKMMGHSVPAPDIAYPLAMLAARFLAYGAGLWFAARDPARHAPWIRLMVWIQLIDLAAGLWHTALGTVPLALSGFPMFNAAWIALLLWRWGPSTQQSATTTGGMAAAAVRY